MHLVTNEVILWGFSVLLLASPKSWLMHVIICILSSMFITRFCQRAAYFVICRNFQKCWKIIVWFEVKLHCVSIYPGEVFFSSVPEKQSLTQLAVCTVYCEWKDRCSFYKLLSSTPWNIELLLKWKVKLKNSAVPLGRLIMKGW